MGWIGEEAPRCKTKKELAAWVANWLKNCWRAGECEVHACHHARGTDWEGEKVVFVLLTTPQNGVMETWIASVHYTLSRERGEILLNSRYPGMGGCPMDCPARWFKLAAPVNDTEKTWRAHVLETARRARISDMLKPGMKCKFKCKYTGGEDVFIFDRKPGIFRRIGDGKLCRLRHWRKNFECVVS